MLVADTRINRKVHRHGQQGDHCHAKEAVERDGWGVEGNPKRKPNVFWIARFEGYCYITMSASHVKRPRGQVSCMPPVNIQLLTSSSKMPGYPKPNNSIQVNA